MRDERQVLHTFKELRELLWRCLPDEPRFTDDAWLFRPVGAWVSLGRSTQAAGLGWLVWRLWRADAQANDVECRCSGQRRSVKPTAWHELPQANGLTQASPGEARDERLPGSENKE